MQMTAIGKVTFAAAAIFMPSGAWAGGLEDSMAEAPKFDVVVQKDFFALERCLVMQNYGAMGPLVYRTPDRPNESLVYFDNLGVGSIAVAKLEKAESGVRVRMWQGGKKVQSTMERCF